MNFIARGEGSYDQRFDVVTEGVFLEKGDTIRVIAIEGQRVVVRKA